jgi:hypothetical protein
MKYDSDLASNSILSLSKDEIAASLQKLADLNTGKD